jgi:hypothetical protein
MAKAGPTLLNFISAAAAGPKPRCACSDLPAVQHPHRTCHPGGAGVHTPWPQLVTALLPAQQAVKAPTTLQRGGFYTPWLQLVTALLSARTAVRAPVALRSCVQRSAAQRKRHADIAATPNGVRRHLITWYAIAPCSS